MSTAQSGGRRDAEREPSAPAADDAPPSGPHLGTLVWGLVLLGAGVAIGLSEVADIRIDLSLAVPVAMLVLGGLLVVGAVVTGIRRAG